MVYKNLVPFTSPANELSVFWIILTLGIIEEIIPLIPIKQYIKKYSQIAHRIIL